MRSLLLGRGKIILLNRWLGWSSTYDFTLLVYLDPSFPQQSFHLWNRGFKVFGSFLFIIYCCPGKTRHRSPQQLRGLFCRNITQRNLQLHIACVSYVGVGTPPSMKDFQQFIIDCLIELLQKHNNGTNLSCKRKNALQKLKLIYFIKF